MSRSWEGTGTLGFFHEVRWGCYKRKALTAPPLELRGAASSWVQWLSVSGLSCTPFSLAWHTFLTRLYPVTLTPLSSAPPLDQDLPYTCHTLSQLSLCVTHWTMAFWMRIALCTMPGPLSCSECLLKGF